jgi:cell division protein FtsL
MKRGVNRKGRGILMKAGFVLYIGFCIFATVWLRTEVVNLEYKIGEMDRLRADLLIDRERVVAQKASFFSTQNVEQLAVGKLGMELVERENIFFVTHAMTARPRVASSVRVE